MNPISLIIISLLIFLIIFIPIVAVIQLLEKMKRQRLELRIKLISRQSTVVQGNLKTQTPTAKTPSQSHVGKILFFVFLPIIPIYIVLTDHSVFSIFYKISFYFALIGIFYFLIKTVRTRRYRKLFIKELPSSIELLVRSLRAGRTITDSIKTVGEENRGPVADQFRNITDQFELGRDFISVVNDISSRLRIPEFTFFVIVLSVQQETGGNIIKILTSLVNMLRQRELMLMKIKALSAEGIFSAIFMLSLPLVVMGIFFLLRPEYISVLFTEPKGQYMLLGGAATEILGCLVIFRMVKIDV